MAIALHPLVLVLAVVRVTGDATCPAPAEVAARLEPLLRPLRDAGASDEVRLEANGAKVRVSLWDGARLSATRDLPMQRSCAELSELAAVVVAAWEIDLHPELGEATPLSMPTAMPPPAARRALEIGAGPAGNLAGSSARPGAAALAVWRPQQRRLGVRVGADAAIARTTELPAGAAEWRRITFAAGPVYARGLGSWVLEARVGPVLSLLQAEGKALPQVEATRGFEPGGAAGARGAKRYDRWAFWLDVSVLAWANHQRVYVAAADGSRLAAPLPRAELTASLGLSILLGD